MSLSSLAQKTLDTYASSQAHLYTLCLRYVSGMSSPLTPSEKPNQLDVLISTPAIYGLGLQEPKNNGGVWGDGDHHELVLGPAWPSCLLACLCKPLPRNEVWELDLKKKAIFSQDEKDILSFDDQCRHQMHEVHKPTYRQN